MKDKRYIVALVPLLLFCMAWVFPGLGGWTGTATSDLDMSTYSVINVGDGTESAPSGGVSFGDGDTGFYESADDILRLYLGASAWTLLFDGPAYRASFGTSTGGAQITAYSAVSTPTYTFYGDTNMGMYRSAADTLDLVTNGTLGLRLESDQDLKWGGATAGHDYSLTVDGETNDGTLTYMEDEDRWDFGEDTAHTDGTNPHGGYITKVYSSTSGTLTGATDTIPLAIPSGWQVKACQLHVKTAVSSTGADPDTWDAELNDGAQEEVIATTLASSQNTNHNHFSALTTDAETNILVTPDDGNFDAGEIEATCQCFGFVEWSNE